MRNLKISTRILLATAVMLAGAQGLAYESVSDPQVTEHLEEALMFDPVAPFNSIDINTTEGIVSLTGTVNNLRAKERVERIAETVRGVRSVVNRIEVQPPVKQSGETLSRAVSEALAYDVATEAIEIRVEADDKGKVTLTGVVDSWQEHQLATNVAKGVSGVTAVDNRIDIVAKAERPDSEIRPEIEQRLRTDVLVDANFVDVSVDDGRVSLSGYVGSAAEKRRAEWDAWVTGVQAVDVAQLEVRDWAEASGRRDARYTPASDQEIHQAIRDAFLYDPRVAGFDIEVQVDDGMVTLRGLVSSMAAKRAAERDARNTAGVIAVDSLIKVRPTGMQSDEDIAERVRAALARNPFTEPAEIEVSVRNGNVYLSGNVDTQFDKVEAENVAFGAVGVTDVFNNLTVSRPEVITYDPYVYDWSVYDYPWYESVPTVSYKSDRQIREDIQDQYLWSPFVDGSNIDVSVEGGVATLSGTVDSWSEYRSARENAFEGGAVSVVNRLEVN